MNELYPSDKMLKLQSENRWDKIYLTHDIDSIWSYDTLSEALIDAERKLIQRKNNFVQPLVSYFSLECDPIYTFSWLIEQDKKLVNKLEGKSTIIYFLMGCKQRGLHDSGYLNKTKKVEQVFKYLRENGCTFGYHTSYAASMDRELVSKEINNLRRTLGLNVFHSRDHFLDSRNPEDYRDLISVGIKHDYTMAYADILGFRLGTCRAVNWIDPYSMKKTKLIMHPLTVMECTLDSDSYMNIKDEEKAFEKIKLILNESWKYGGEISLLWHNTSVSKERNGYHRHLYPRVIKYILEKEGEIYDRLN